MLRVARLFAVLALSSVCFADNVTFLRIDQALVQQRVRTSPNSAAARVAALRSQFLKAGCGRDHVREQSVPGQTLPNVICTLPGSEEGIIVVGARLEFDMRGDEGQVGWASVAMLPLLAESLAATPHRHTLVFIAFSGGDGLTGSSHYLKQLTDPERHDLRAVVDLDHLGRTNAGYALPEHETVLTRLLPAAARALQMKDQPSGVTGVVETDALPFERAHIPVITIHSPGYELIGKDATHPTANEIAPSFRRIGTPTVSSNQSFALKTGFDPQAYNSTYNLLCVYMLFLDRGVPAGKRAPAMMQADATRPGPTVPQPAGNAAMTPAVSSPPAVPTVLTASNGSPSDVAAPKPEERIASPSATVASQAPIGSEATFRATARLVQVDVVVTDSQGHPVRDLKPSDFVVQEDGATQSVHVFEAHVPKMAAQTSTATTATPGTPRVSPVHPRVANTYSNVPNDEPEASWTVVLFDLLNTPTADQAYARSQLLQLLKAAPPGQPVALFVLTQRLEMLQGFTQDPAQLLRSAELLNPSQSQILTTRTERERDRGTIENTARVAAPASAVATGNTPAFSTDSLAYSQASRLLQWMNDHEAFRTDERIHFTLAAMKGISQAVSGYPGRKNMLWLSGSFPIQLLADATSPDPFRNVRGYEAEVRAAATYLATSRVAVYPVDVRGLQGKGIDITMASSQTSTMNDVAPAATHGVVSNSPNALANTMTDQTFSLADERATMKNIAEQTGGEAFVNTNDLRRALQRSLEDGGTYYTLAYTPPKDESNKGFHRINVRLGRPGLKLSYRRGYYTLPKPSATENGTAALQAALQAGMPPSTMMFLTATVRAADGVHRETVVDYIIDANGATFADTPDQKKHAQIDCMVIAFDKEGREVAHASDTLDATFATSALNTILTNGLPAHQELTLGPGLYNLRIGVMDRTTQAIGTVEVPLVVAESAVAQK